MGKASRSKRVAAAAPAADGGPERPPLHHHKHTLPICVALILFVLLVFGRTAFNGFIEFDDPAYVGANPVVQKGLTLEGIKYAFTALAPYYWQPLTWISHEIDATFFDNRPGPQHLVSVVIHGLTAALLFLFLQRATGATWPAALAAAI